VKKEAYVEEEEEEVVIKKNRVEEKRTITEEVKSGKLIDDGIGDNFK
jgi:hypothetical protein